MKVILLEKGNNILLQESFENANPLTVELIVESEEIDPIMFDGIPIYLDSKGLILLSFIVNENDNFTHSKAYIRFQDINRLYLGVGYNEDLEKRLKNYIGTLASLKDIKANDENLATLIKNVFNYSKSDKIKDIVTNIKESPLLNNLSDD